MSEKDDETFKTIFELNGLSDLLDNSEIQDEDEVTIKDFQIGLADITSVSAYLSAFLLEAFNAFSEGESDKVPEISAEILNELREIFYHADCMMELLEEEEEDADEDY